MLPPKIPKIINKKSQALLESEALALLTMAIEIKAITRTMINGTIWPQPSGCSGLIWNTLSAPKTENTIPATISKTTIQTKKLAMLYITFEAFSI